MLQDFLRGLRSYSQALDVLSRYNLWSYMLIPGLISLVLGGAAIGVAVSYADDLGSLLTSYYPFEFGRGIVEAAAAIVSGLLMVVVFLLLFKYIVMVLVAPFMGLLSEQIESKLTGRPGPDFDLVQMLADVWRGLRVALRNLLRELVLTLGITLLGFIVPVIGNAISALLIFLVQAYYAGFGNMDYTLERKRFGLGDSVAFVRQHRWVAIGNGSLFVLLLLVPVLGIFVAPTIGTASATLLSLERMPRGQ